MRQILAGVVIAIAIVGGVSVPAAADYVSDCKSVIEADHFWGAWRLGYDYQSKGETYPLGRPKETTGYYTNFEISLPGNQHFTLTCNADLNNNFTFARIYGGDWHTCYYRDRPQQECR